MLNNEIGEAAGVIWEYLSTYGEASSTRICQETRLESKLCQRAIGWLAKEDKLKFRRQGRTELISLL